jgi:hypothetical protein
MEEGAPTKCWNAIYANAHSEETRMDSNYVFPCRVMWWFGQQDAGKEYSGLLFAGIQKYKPCVGLFALACS